MCAQRAPRARSSEIAVGRRRNFASLDALLLDAPSGEWPRRRDRRACPCRSLSLSPLVALQRTLCAGGRRQCVASVKYYSGVCAVRCGVVVCVCDGSLRGLRLQRPLAVTPARHRRPIRRWTASW